MTLSKPVDHAQAWMSGEYTESTIEFRQAVVREGLSKLTEMTVIFQSHKPDIDMKQFIGKKMNVHLDTAEDAERDFGGICVSVESLGFRSGHFQFVAVVRPMYWLLTKTTDCRIFQNMTTKEIVEKVLSEAGITEYKFKLGDQYEPRQYCVQYRETDYDFLCRLCEQDGIYFYLDTKNGFQEPDELTFCDGKTSHKSDGTVEFDAHTAGDFSSRLISEWAPTRQITSGVVTIDDIDFFAPTAEKRKSVKETKILKGAHVDGELYDYPGQFRSEGETPRDANVKKEPDKSEKRAQVRLEAEVCHHQTWRGAASVQTLGVGRLFKMAKHPESAANIEYLITGAEHFINASMDIKNDATNFDMKPRHFDMPEDKEGIVYSVTIEAIDAKIQYRAPQRTPWPVIPGLQTALVVGPKGEEIWTDDYGRIRVEFPWDREGKKDENSSCWIRVATPWAGKNWGFAAVPRIGQEVIIQFEDGDPGRPICTGMLYNEDNPKVYSKKATSTEIGIRTDSTKDVKDAQAFNELMFDDVGGKELMRVQAQKDHRFLTKNISRIGVGLKDADTLKNYKFKHADDGSLLQVVKNHVEEEVQEGDHYYTVTKGSQEKVIHTDFKTTVETGDTELTVEKGKLLQTIKDNFETTVQSGDMSVGVNKGNISVSADMGKIEIEAKQKIVLKVGQSKITLDMSGVTIDAPMINVKAKGMATVKGKMTTVKGDAMLTLKGGVTMIN